MEFVEELIDHWDGELILGRLVVESPVVDAKAPGLVCFLHQQYWSGEWGRSRAGDALVQHDDTLPLKFVLLELWYRCGYRYGRTATGAVPGSKWIR
jgi:hypothetical protein